ncbi:MAG: hypothetical protein IPQ09_16995 [Myxococcales bacterium]|nr:hypothetical protein [Myxococcales bacterium]HQY63887.1 hypothetical protein [Polyangiaceae bacterium]
MQVKEAGMFAKWMRRLGMSALVGGLVWTSVGCAGERDPINRVQPNAMPKSFFLGKLGDANDDPEFYMRNTVIDVPYGAAQDGLFTATYAQPTNRIKWEVQERALIARSTFERIQDSDHKGSRRTNDGQVVGMFTIESHFDVRRDYNSSTGEEMNVIVENNTDRPWYQREYMRVDWSKNLVTDGYEVDTLSQIGLYGAVKFSPMEYKVEDPDSPDAPVFSAEEGYFDVATKAFATPQMIDTPWGAFPACYFYGIHPAGNCNPTELTLRLSFRKVVETDFEPSDWDGNRMEAFGAFYADRYGYERNYGILDTKWHRLAAKYNMFERSHISQNVGGRELFAQCNTDFWRDENGDVMKFRADGARDATTGLPIPDPSGKPFAGSSIAQGQARESNRWKILDGNNNKTDDECEFLVDGKVAHPGSRCDTLAHRCTLPLNERKTRKIPWYYGKDGPADLFPSTAVALEQWNVSAKQAIQAGKRADALRVDKDATAFVTSEEQIAKREGAAKDIEDIFVLCHSPVIESDDKACGKVGTEARIGDLRYNSVNIINTPQDPSPWGIMVDSDDPLTGEKVQTSVNEWGHILDLAVQGTADYLRWLNGEITDDQVTSGEYMLDWARASNFGQNAFQPKVLSQAEVQSRLDSIASADGNGNFLPRRKLRANEKLSAKEMRGKLKARAETRKRSGVPLDRNNEIEARRKQFVGSKFESLLATKEMQVAAGVDARNVGPIANDAMLARVSPLRGMNPELRRWVQRQKDSRAHEHASCSVQAPEPTAQMGLARQAQKLYPLPDREDPDYAAKKAKRDRDLFQWLREQFHISVILHEMGHSMGLRHNFAGNFDALNFHTQYWQLRTRNGAEKLCQQEGVGTVKSYKPHTNGEDCVGGRWFDPVTEKEQNGLLTKWGQSTVMDYPGDTAQDMNGLGKYDKAWMRNMYADLVDVDVDSDVGNKANYYPLLAETNTGGVLGPFLVPSYWKLHDLFNTVGTCEGGSPSDPLSAKCTGQLLDYRKIYDMVDASGTTRSKEFGEIDYGGTFNKSPDGFARHPYMFSSDEFADGGNVLVYRHDAGADLYEQAQYFIASYENRYIFDNFRRNRVMFNVEGAVDRTLYRYFEKMTATTKAMGLLLPDLGSDAGVYLEHEDLLLTHALASSMGFEEFIKVLTRPEPGAYRYSKSRDFTDTCATKSYAEVSEYYADDLCKSESETTPPAFTLKVGQGGVRYMHNEYDYSKGYEWSSYLRWVGSYYEKVYVQFYLNEAYNNFLQNSRDDYIDGRDRNINYATIYPEQMRRLNASLLQNDNTFYAPYVMPQQPGFAVSADPVQWLPLDRFAQADPGTTSLGYPAGAVRINPLVGWEQQFPAIIFNYIYGSTTLTMDWANQMRIWYPDSDGSLSVPLNQQVRYQDPLTGIQYAARSYGKETMTGRQVQRTAGARMLQYANDFAASTFVVTATDGVTGQHTYQRAGVANEPVCKPGLDEDTCTRAKKRLRYFGGNLDTVREIALYVQGPLSGQ